MGRLGYARYGVQGTDAGVGVAGMLAMADPGSVAGVHLTGTTAGMAFGRPIELEGLSVADRARAERFNAYQGDQLGYLHLQATRPQTLAYALNDSPARQLAWIVELPDDAVDRDQLLCGVSEFWFTAPARPRPTPPTRACRPGARWLPARRPSRAATTPSSRTRQALQLTLEQRSNGRLQLDPPHRP